jgi:alkylhydroperoxidase family enzyme
LLIEPPTQQLHKVKWGTEVMPTVKSLPDTAGPPAIYKQYPDIYLPWSEMSQALMNGPSPLTPAERELIFAFAAGVAGCDFVYIAHSEVAYAWGIPEGLLDILTSDFEAAPVDDRLKTLLRFVRRLVLIPQTLTQADTEAVFSAGWDDKALHDAIAITARMSFMQKLVEGYAFRPLSKEIAREHAKKRVRSGYVKVYRTFANAIDAEKDELRVQQINREQPNV